MMRWLSNNWQWAALNLAALAIMANLVRPRAIGDTMPDAEFVDSGKWAIRFLLLSLAMTPLNTLLGWRSAIRLRKPAGLWAFGFVALHFVYYFTEVWPDWLLHPIPDYIAGLGVAAFVILAAMAMTSTKWAMKRMGKWWKGLHRLVYAASIVGVTHGLLETTHKRVMMFDEQAAYEVQIYIALLAVLLAVRIPPVRKTLALLRHRLASGRPRGSALPTA